MPANIISKVKHTPQKKRFSNNHELKALSAKCKAAWKMGDAGKPRLGPEFEETKTLKKLTNKCANKCYATQECLSWEKRQKLFREKDPRRFKTLSSVPPLGNRLFHIGKSCQNLPKSNPAGWITFSPS